MYYQQIRGASMGAPWAPAYTCLHLGYWEEKVVAQSEMYQSHVLTWLHYIDDVLVSWGSFLQQFKLLVDELNINLTYMIDERQISFLDLADEIQSDGSLCTRTYRKAAMANTWLPAMKFLDPWTTV